MRIKTWVWSNAYARNQVKHLPDPAETLSCDKCVRQRNIQLIFEWEALYLDNEVDFP